MSLSAVTEQPPFIQGEPLIRLFGPIEVSTMPDANIPLSTARLLALLVLKRGNAIAYESLLDVLPGSNTIRTLQKNISILRKLTGLEKKIIYVGRRGYKCTLPAEQIDVFRFKAYLEYAEKLARQSKWLEAYNWLKQTWNLLLRGPFLIGIECRGLHKWSVAVQAWAHSAVSLQCMLALKLGYFKEVEVELLQFLLLYPQHQELITIALVWLHEKGHVHEALVLHNQVRLILSQLGTRPLGRLRAILDDIERVRVVRNYRH